jgi:hypothetical protein
LESLFLKSDLLIVRELNGLPQQALQAFEKGTFTQSAVDAISGYAVLTQGSNCYVWNVYNAASTCIHIQLQMADADKHYAPHALFVLSNNFKDPSLVLVTRSGVVFHYPRVSHMFSSLPRSKTQQIYLGEGVLVTSVAQLSMHHIVVGTDAGQLFVVPLGSSGSIVEMSVERGMLATVGQLLWGASTDTTDEAKSIVAICAGRTLDDQQTMVYALTREGLLQVWKTDRTRQHKLLDVRNLVEDIRDYSIRNMYGQVGDAPSMLPKAIAYHNK